jgi:hypothetical protein
LPLMWIAVRLSAPAAFCTPESLAIEAAFVAANVS